MPAKDGKRGLKLERVQYGCEMSDECGNEACPQRICFLMFSEGHCIVERVPGAE